MYLSMYAYACVRTCVCTFMYYTYLSLCISLTFYVQVTWCMVNIIISPITSNDPFEFVRS